MNTVIEYGVLGFGLVGACVAGNAASKLIKRNGGSEAEALVSGCVAAGLSVAVLPATAVGGVCATIHKGFELYKHSDQARLVIANARAQTLGTMDKVINKTKSRQVKAVRA